MEWIFSLAVLGFFYWVARRAAKRTSELEPTGIMRSPLYWTSNALVLILIALALYMARTQSPIPAFLWFVVVAIMVALLVLRRELKWRSRVGSDLM